MKILRILSLLMALLMMLSLVACDNGKDTETETESATNADTNTDTETESETESATQTDTETESETESATQTDTETETETEPEYTEEELAEIKAILDAAYALADGQYLDGTYTLTGVITQYTYNSQYGDANLTIVVADFVDQPMYCYQVKGDDAAKIKVGDTITVTGAIKNYKGTIEFEKPTLDSYVSGGEVAPKPPVGDLTTVEGILNAAYALGAGETLDGTYTLTGVITVYKFNASYGDANVTIVIEGFEDKPMYCYQLKGDDVSKIKVGDTITVTGAIKNYNGTVEFDKPTLDSFEAAPLPDITDYVASTIAEARAAETGKLVKVTGVVARITYANGMVPSGFILVNGADSIYVYGAIAAQVKIGNTVEVAGSKTYWVLETEQSNADKFGYKGCNQLENPILLSNVENNAEWINADIPTSTVMDMLNTPVTEDVTTKIFKVNALVKEVKGDGFTNFYFFDLDGETGSYAYSQCNGNDFTWLREFDGKICTVYLTALNAKSTASDCFFRFLPVAVVDEGYVFDTNNAPSYAVKYHGLTQFLSNYSGDPALELVTNVSSTLLGFEGVTLSYASSNTAAVTFTEVDGKVIMNCVGAGTATVTVTATYNGVTAEDTFEITVVTADSIDFVNVQTAINAEVNTVVSVKGIVGPAVANQVAFYLIDETGAIAIRTTSDVLATLKLGYEVIITGTRTITKDGGGQICLDNATVAYNGYGDHAIPNNSFITDKTVADLVALEDTPANTTGIYVMTATISRSSTAYSTNTFVNVGDKGLMLYAGGKGDYAWAEEYVGQEITVIVAPCDWNAKGIKGALLGIILEDGTIVYNTNYKA